MLFPYWGARMLRPMKSAVYVSGTSDCHTTPSAETCAIVLKNELEILDTLCTIVDFEVFQQSFMFQQVSEL